MERSAEQTLEFLELWKMTIYWAHVGQGKNPNSFIQIPPNLRTPPLWRLRAMDPELIPESDFSSGSESPFWGFEDDGVVACKNCKKVIPQKGKQRKSCLK